MNVELLEAKLSQQPQSPLFARLADEYLSLGRTAEAKNLLLSGIEQYPAYATAHLVLARCFQAEGNYLEALDSLDEAFVLVPNSIKLKELREEWIRRSRGEALPEEEPTTGESVDAVEVAEPATEGADGIPSIESPREVAQEAPKETTVEEIHETQIESDSIDQTIETSSEEIATEIVSPEVLSPPIIEEPEIITLPPPAESEEPPAAPEPTLGVEAEPPILEETAEPLAVEPVTEETLSTETAPAEAPIEPPAAIPPAREIVVDGGVRKFQQPATSPEATPAEKAAPSDADWRIITKTLAEIYASQGAYEEAIITYQLLKEQRPDLQEEIEQRMGELALLLREKIVQQKQK